MGYLFEVSGCCEDAETLAVEFLVNNAGMGTFLFFIYVEVVGS